MGVCFLCDTKLYGERTRVCSSITPHSNVPYPEKIVELLGEDFVVIVTPADHMCKRCTSLLTHMDKLENDLKLVKTAMMSYIQKKYGLLPADQPVKTLDVVNGHLKTEEQPDASQKKVSSSSSGTALKDNIPVNSTLKILKPQQQPTSTTESASKVKIYKCGFCTFQSKELGHVRFHMRTHVKKDEKPSQSAAAKSLAPPIQTQKKRLYRCQVCSTSFDSRMSCLDHIQKDHNAPAAANEDKESEEVPTESSSKDEVKAQDNQSAETPMEVDGNNGGQQEEENKGTTVDTNMLLNDHVQGAADEQEETAADEQESQNTGVEASDQEKSAPDQEQETESEQAEATPSTSTQENDQAISDNVEKRAEEGTAVDNDENKTGDLDIESMLAAIHNDNAPPDSSETPNED